MKKYIWQITIILIAFLFSCENSVATDGSPLKGTWQEVFFSFSSPDSSWEVKNTQPGIYIFMEKHHSIMYVPGDHPRELFENYWGPTDAEKLKAYDTFWASSGRYTYTDSTLTTRPILAKNPNFTKDGSLTYFYKVKGDTLIMHRRHQWSKDPSQYVESFRKLIRLE